MDFRACQLAGANLMKANLSGADLTGDRRIGGPHSQIQWGCRPTTAARPKHDFQLACSTGPTT